MSSQNNNIGTTFTIVVLFTVLLTGLFFVNSDISQNNDKLDIDSQQLLSDMNTEYSDKFNYTQLDQKDSNVTVNSTFEGVDAFARQYLEDKSEITKKESLINKILNFPSLFLRIFGLEDSLMLIAFNVLVYSLLTFFLGLQIYKAVRTGEVD